MGALNVREIIGGSALISDPLLEEHQGLRWPTYRKWPCAEIGKGRFFALHRGLLSFAQKHGIQGLQQYQQIQEKGKILDVEQFILKRLHSVRNRINPVGLGPPRDPGLHVIAHPVKGDGFGHLQSEMFPGYKADVYRKRLWAKIGNREVQIAENGFGPKSVKWVLEFSLCAMLRPLVSPSPSASPPRILPNSAFRLLRSELPTSPRP